MIQRIQSVYLFIAFILGIASIFLTFYTVEVITPVDAESIFIKMSNYMYVIPVIAGIISFATIFLYNNRKLQLKLCMLIMLLALASLAQVAIVFTQTSPSALEDIELGPLMPLLILVFAFLARHSINKDEKLVKSLDRLR